MNNKIKTILMAAIMSSVVLTQGVLSLIHIQMCIRDRGEGDDEQIMIDLSKVPANIERIAFTVTIYDAEARRQNFGQVSNSYIRLVDESNEVELILSLIHIQMCIRDRPYTVIISEKISETGLML